MSDWENLKEKLLTPVKSSPDAFMSIFCVVNRINFLCEIYSRNSYEYLKAMNAGSETEKERSRAVIASLSSILEKEYDLPGIGQSKLGFLGVDPSRSRDDLSSLLEEHRAVVEKFFDNTPRRRPDLVLIPT